MKLRYLFAALCLCLLLVSPAAAAGGSGTAANPYIIQTAAELQSIQNNLAAYYKLANDINLQGVSFTPIGSVSSPFIGSFDGAGYTISNLVISSSTQSTGFFRCLGSGATIKDITFQDCSVTSTSPWCGVVIGSIIMSSSAHSSAVISNVDCVRCSASTSSYYVSCLVGFIYTLAVVEITDCDVSYSEAKSNGGYTVGCLVGQCHGASSTEITRCNVLYSQAHAGEVAGCFVGSCDGESSLVIDSSRAQNSIAKITGNNIVSCIISACSGGSSVNVLNCDVVNCLAKGRISVGGIVGLCEGSGSVVTAQTCTVSGCTIVATKNYAGGIAGRCISGATGIFSDCSVTDSTIIASDYAAVICPVYS